MSQTAGNLYYHIFGGSCLGSIMFKCGKFKEAKDISR
jgi:hypothetical protein